MSRTEASTGHTTNQAKHQPKRAATGQKRAATGQLRLLSGDRSRTSRKQWALDERTRRIGRAGIEAVRETLRNAHPPEPVQKAS
jgi:hypothetical protein